MKFPNILETKRLKDDRENKEKQLEIHQLPAGATFVFSRANEAWQEARESCRLMGGDLAVLSSYREVDFVKQFIPKVGWQRYWIGGTSPDGKDNWKWVTGEPIPLSFGRWRSGEPRGGGKCLRICGENQFGLCAFYCNTKFAHICKIEN